MTDTPAQEKAPKKRLGRWLIPLLLVAAIGIGIVIGLAATPQSAGPAEGSALFGTAAPATQPTVLRVATFNIHSGVGKDDKLDLDRTAKTLAGFDLIGLNEVRGATPWEPQPQTELLARKLQRACLFAPTERKWWSDSFGNAMLTTLPVRSWKRIPLERSPGRGYRNLILADAPFAGGVLHIMITHVDRGADREKQLRQLSDQFLKLDEPAVFMGDFNSRPDDPLIKALLSAPGVSDAVGLKLGANPPDRIDWIFSRGLKSVDAGQIENGASDHPMAWAAFTK